ncbi:MAG: hypothetical protein IPK13_20240 [Deltaproteobacteria bacterium]|nr:hypothetical protein [Deltaproteobacteria bacterium]
MSNPIAPLPLRIGLAKGEVQIEPALGLYIGRGIVHAYETEQSQDWIGGSLHDSVTPEELARVQSKHTLIPLVVRHLIPRRGGSASEGYALNWSINIGDRSFVQSTLNELKMAAGTLHARKYDEAIKFYDTHRPAAMDRSRN